MKLYTGLLIAALLGAPQMGFAAQIVRQASARIVVYKTTMTKVNGKYTKSESKVCEETKSFPVTDERAAGTIPRDVIVSSVCESTVQNKPVLIVTTPLTWLSESNTVPWKPGQKVNLKGLGVISYVYSKDMNNPPSKLQDTLRATNFTEDLNLKELGFALTPFVEFSKTACSDPTPSCDPTEHVSLEEYFGVYVYIEDKNI